MTHKVRCYGCGWRGTSEDLLTAPNPFIAGFDIAACPECRDMEQLERACAADGCWKDATCGCPDKDGVYHVTCFNHSPMKSKRAD